MTALQLVSAAQSRFLSLLGQFQIGASSCAVAVARRGIRAATLGALVVLPMLGIQSQAQADSRLPYGPDTCKNGFVFREAYTDDHVCVTSAVRAQVAQDNAAAVSRIQPGGGLSGHNTCKQGFVWREARPQDLVCVDTSQRTQAADDNRLAYSRQQARLAQGVRLPPKKHLPLVPVDHDGKTVDEQISSGTAQCKLSGVHCPKRMQAAFDVSEGCICKE